MSVGVGQSVITELRMRLFTHLQAQSVAFHGEHASGTLASRASSDVEAVRELFENGIDRIITAAVSLIYVPCVLLVLDWRLGAAALAAMAPVCWTMHAFRRRSLDVYHRRSAAAGAAAGDMSETFAGIRTVRAFGREDINERRFARLNRRHRKENRQAELEMARYVTSSRLVANTAVAGLVLWGGYRVAPGTLELGTYAGFVLYREDVSFAYPGGHEVLRGFALDIPAGQTVALIGPSGGGKSTLAGLLARFHDPTRGRVLLDGVDLRSLATAELRHGVVMVPQEGFLFSGSVAENIAMARPDATPDEIRQAAEATGAHRFISALQDGYRTEVGDRGGRFSSGQRQLIALARVFLVNPSVIVLDEATAVIDIPSERAVLNAMRTVFRKRTALVIAHRLSTVHVADRVLVLADGRVIEDCAPADLGSGRGAADPCEPPRPGVAGPPAC
ncbi:ABC transporter ATP-binding protein [Streptomyces sp. NBC_01477]|uniref:ABC transporter ATP-binding protein n=1 Tax=Streptomyces sp. NBC_01477 TaxID=2976015 RepID=UPI002E2FCED9|nr:ABC transporter ATP-binding protein [Streptomyces sp. NBC_01477]